MIHHAARRFCLFATLLGTSSIVPLAQAASTTVRLNTMSGTCVATTNDAAGVHLDPAGSDALVVDGVTLSEQPANSHACQPAGSSSADFQLSPIVVSEDANGTVTTFTPAINVPFYVNWSVGPDATTCVRTGSSNINASTMDGWVLGSVLSAPAGVHHEAVTPKQSGDYSFGVICSNATGFKIGAAPHVPPSDTTPITIIPTITPSTVDTGAPPVPATITISADANAALANMSCTGSVQTASGAPSPGWTGWSGAFSIPASGALSQSVTVPSSIAVGTYTFTLNCALGQQTANGQASLVVQDPALPSACPSTIPAGDPRLAGQADTSQRVRMNVADIKYGVVPQGVRQGVRFDEFKNIWGYNAPTTPPPPVEWPGIIGSSPGFLMPRSGYFAVKFTTGATAPSPGAGYFASSTYGGSIALSASISETCADFAGDPAVNACYARNVQADDGGTLNWLFGNQPSTKWFCYLKPNTTYYMNVMFSSTTEGNSRCGVGATACHVMYVRR
ncbi:hypothetical protein FBQ98_00705 [Gammaproteobacteria bacterium PRO6]|nr:hypothetical protein [Gammaproteobacteria bacterium PRO6]